MDHANDQAFSVRADMTSEDERRRKVTEAWTFRFSAFAAAASVAILGVSTFGAFYLAHTSSHNAELDREATSKQFFVQKRTDAYEQLVATARDERVAVSNAVYAIKTTGHRPAAFTAATFAPLYHAAQAAAAYARGIAPEELVTCITRIGTVDLALNDTAHRMLAEPGWLPVTGPHGIINASYQATKQMLVLERISLTSSSTSTKQSDLKAVLKACNAGPPPS